MRQRMVVNIGDEDGNLGLLDFRITTFESGDGDLYSFDSQHELQQGHRRGGRRRGAAAGLRHRGQLKQPSEKTVKLDGGALFPSQHLQIILDAAMADAGILSADDLRGRRHRRGERCGERGDRPGGCRRPRRPAARRRPPLARLHRLFRRGRRGDGRGTGRRHAELPDALHALRERRDQRPLMDYGDYALSGALKEIEPLDGRPAPHAELLPDCAARGEGQAERQAVAARSERGSCPSRAPPWRAWRRRDPRDRPVCAKLASPNCPTPDPDQSKPRAVQLLAQAVAAGPEDAVGEVGRVVAAGGCGCAGGTRPS